MLSNQSFFAVLLFLSSFVFINVSAQCSRIWERREWRTLSVSARSTYIQANLRLQQETRDSNGYNTFDRYSSMHSRLNVQIHGNWVFLPWHRYFLLNFERELRRVSSGITVPYWSASLDSQSLESAPVFGTGNSTFGGSGSGSRGCVTTGPFRNWRPRVPSDHCLRRNTRTGVIQPVDMNTRDVNLAASFGVFSTNLEGGFHAQVHNSIGGDMSLFTSPNDPLFYLHHCNVDKLWAVWQRRSGNLMRYVERGAFHVNANGNRISVSLNYQLPGYAGITVQSVLSTESLCYRYVEINNNDIVTPSLPTFNPSSGQNSNGQTRMPVLNRRQEPLTELNNNTANMTNVTSSEHIVNGTDLGNLLKLRVFDIIPDSWIEMNSLNKTFIRLQEQEKLNAIKELNKVEGYVSPCALWNRPDMLVKLVEEKKVETFYAKVNGSKVEVKVDQNLTNPLQAVSNIIGKISNTLGNIQAPVTHLQLKLENIIGPSVFGTNCTLNPYGSRVTKDLYSKVIGKPRHKRCKHRNKNGHGKLKKKCKKRHSKAQLETSNLVTLPKKKKCKKHNKPLQVDNKKKKKHCKKRPSAKHY